MSAPSSLTRLSRFAAFAARCVVTVAQGANYRMRAFYGRRTARALLELDDYMLRDLGITRGDVHAALSGPVDTDPTVRLRVMAVERRAAGREAQREILADAGLLQTFLQSRRETLSRKESKAPSKAA